MYNKLIQISQNILKALFSDEKLSQLQRQLILANFNLKIEEFFIIITTLTMTTTTIVAIIVEILKMTHIITLIVLISIPTVTINYIIYKNEKIKDQIEEDLPLYLRSISSLLKVGVGLEGALYELTENMTGPLNNEIKIALTEIQFGKTFNDALKSITKRNKSENLKNTIEIIIHTRNAGANLAEILEMIADDLTQTLQLKKEKKAAVMMSVMFLLIASTVAIPFSFSMMQLYSLFLAQLGKTNPLINSIPIASIGYIIIHSIIVSFLIADVMYSNYKKSIKFIFLILPTAVAIYYISQLLISNMLLGGI